MKYYLLTFNEDYGDEHDVPALSCMTENEYNKWLETPSGELNLNFEKEKENYENNEKLSNTFWGTLKKENIQNTTLIPKDRQDLIDLEKNYRSNYKYIKYPKKVNSNLNAWLGNSGDGFEENYENLYLMKEYVEKNYVKVFEVNEDFYNIFHLAKLSSLSLCNVFTINEY